MTIFAMKRMGATELDRLQARIGELQIRLRNPPDLMMLSAPTAQDPEQRDLNVYIGLPSAVLLVAFPDFVEVAREALPDFLTPLVAGTAKFEELFPDILRKCRDQFMRQSGL